MTTLRPLLLALALTTGSAFAQDVVTLHSVTLDANDQVTVVYSKNFATCAHLRFSNATCTQNGPLTHVANHFCAQGTNVAVTVPASAFVAGFGPGIDVYMVHGNNSGVRSSCTVVECDGAYGTGCAGSNGVPVLDAVDDCPPAGTSADLLITNGPPGSVAVLGFGTGPFSFPLLGCTLLIDNVAATVALFFDANGDASFTLPLPPGVSGASFTAQAFAIDAAGPQGFSATNGLLVRVL